MNTPFKIFPSSGYLNSQFQILSNYDNLEITIIYDDKIEKSFMINSGSVAIINDLDKAGFYKAICTFENKNYIQPFEVKDAYRFGSSVFKAAYTFENIDYSFFLMKDRMLIYDEKKEIIYTENNISPNDIKKINDDYLLFITKNNNQSNNLINFGLFNIQNLSLVDEVLNTFEEIIILENENKIWCKDIINKAVVCLEIVDVNFNYFKEIFRVSQVEFCKLNFDSTHIFIDTPDNFIVCNLKTVEFIKHIKSEFTAIDNDGFFYEINDNVIKCENYSINYHLSFSFGTISINFLDSHFFHLGKKFKTSLNKFNFSEIVTKISNEVIPNINYKLSFYNYKLSQEDIYNQTVVSHQLFPTLNGFYLLTSTHIKRLESIRFFKNHDNLWGKNENTIDDIKYNLCYYSHSKEKNILIDLSYNPIFSYNALVLIIRKNNGFIAFNGQYSEIFNSNISISFLNFPSDNKKYLIAQNNNLFSFYNINNSFDCILKNIEVFNFDYLKDHSVVWYKLSTNVTNNDTIPFKCYSLITSSFFSSKTLFKSFFSHYALASSSILVNNEDTIANIKNGYGVVTALGKIINVSHTLNKILSRRNELFYLQKFNKEKFSYDIKEINIPEYGFLESHLSPNGKFIVLKEDFNKYSYFDFENNKQISFFSGTFLSFSKEGNLTYQEKNSRAVKIIDPLTLNDVTPSNYKYYKFLSPDGKLYASISKKNKYYDCVLGDFFNKDSEHVIDIINLLSINSQPINTDQNNFEKRRKQEELILQNKEKYFHDNESKLVDIGIKEPKDISVNFILREYIEIGIVNSDKTIPIILPPNMGFYNYAAFSHDNKYFSFVGNPKSFSGSIVGLYKINFDPITSDLSIIDNFFTSYPSMAAWVCSFSKSNYFATYDSVPNTYLIKFDDDLFASKTSATELSNNIDNNSNLGNFTYRNWRVLKGYNFFCFSPSGNFLALSEQGYRAVSIGGCGHLNSNALHIANTNSGDIIASFYDHGDNFFHTRSNNLSFVAFSDNEKRIMSLSTDGVVLIRNINLLDKTQSN